MTSMAPYKARVPGLLQRYLADTFSLCWAGEHYVQLLHAMLSFGQEQTGANTDPEAIMKSTIANISLDSHYGSDDMLFTDLWGNGSVCVCVCWARQMLPCLQWILFCYAEMTWTPEDKLSIYIYIHTTPHPSLTPRDQEEIRQLPG